MKIQYNNIFDIYNGQGWCMSTGPVHYETKKTPCLVLKLVRLFPLMYASHTGSIK